MSLQFIAVVNTFYFLLDFYLQRLMWPWVLLIMMLVMPMMMVKLNWKKYMLRNYFI